MLYSTCHQLYLYVTVTCKISTVLRFDYKNHFIKCTQIICTVIPVTLYIYIILRHYMHKTSIGYFVYTNKNYVMLCDVRVHL